MILSVDLAARFSAGIVMDAGGEVLLQFDSWGYTSFEFAALIAETAKIFEVEHIIIEDVPYGISKQFMIKPVLRLQGMIILALQQENLLSRTVFLDPARWQRSYEGVFRKGIPGAAAAAAALGYTPPDLLALHEHTLPPPGPQRTKDRGHLRKAMTDYVDAFLIARWGVENTKSGSLTDIQGVQAY